VDIKAARICQSRIFGAALQTPHGSTDGQMRVASDLDCATKFEFTDWMLRFALHKIFENTLERQFLFSTTPNVTRSRTVGIGHGSGTRMADKVF